MWVLGAVAAALALTRHWGWVVPAAILLLLAAQGTWDLLQRRHTIFRLYPVLGRARPLMEAVRPQIRQYFIESNTEASPFDRETRDMVYERAAGTKGDEPFGTERDVTAIGYEFLRTPFERDSPTTWIRASGWAVPTAPNRTTSRYSMCPR